MIFKTGDLIGGRFEVKKMLGRGALGIVYLVHDQTRGEDVALKVLLPEVFSRDARLLASLGHPNICAVNDLQEADGAQFRTMPLLEGEALSARIGKGPISIDEALPLFAQIAEALEAAHARGIISGWARAAGIHQLELSTPCTPGRKLGGSEA